MHTLLLQNPIETRAGRRIQLASAATGQLAPGTEPVKSLAHSDGSSSIPAAFDTGGGFYLPCLAPGLAGCIICVGARLFSRRRQQLYLRTQHKTQ